MKQSKRYRAAALAAALSVLLAGCTEKAEGGSDTESVPELSSQIWAEESSKEESVQTEPLTVDLSARLNQVKALELSKADKDVSFDDSAVQIMLQGDTVTTSDASAVKIDGTTITITSENTYVFSGTLNDGRILVNMTDDKAKAHLVLNGAQITCKNSAPLAVMQADKTILTLADGTENSLTDGVSYSVFLDEEQSKPNACLYSSDDLTVNGGGTLIVSGNYKNGIVCKNDLKLVSGKLTVTAENNGIRGDDSVWLNAAEVNVTAKGDGIRTETADKEDKGFFRMDSGKLNISAENDGIDSAVLCAVMGGEIEVVSGGGAKNAAAHHGNDMMFGGDGSHGGFGNFGGRKQRGTDDFAAEIPTPKQTANETQAETTETKSKGIKVGFLLAVGGGSVNVDAADDALHSDDTVYLGGTAQVILSAGDDGVHAEKTLTVAEEVKLNVTKAYEGLEAYSISVAGGRTVVNAEDDGLNAAGEQTQTDSESSAADADNNRRKFGGMGGFGGVGELFISGGYLYVNAAGDGLDSNGDMEISGGTVIVCGPTNNGDGPLDCGDNNNHITVTGGTLMAVGSTGMMEAPEENYLGTAKLNAAAGTLIVATDDSGKVLGALKTPKQADGIVFSADGKKDGYHIYTGGTYDGELDENNWGTGGKYSGGTEIASGSGGVSGGMGFGGGNHGGRNDGNGQPPQMPEGFGGGNGQPPQMPEGFDGGNGQPPQMPEGFDGGNGQPPQMPEGFDPFDRKQQQPQESRTSARKIYET